MPVSPLAITELNSPNVPLVLQLRTYPKNLRQLLTTAHYNRAMNHSNVGAPQTENVIEYKLLRIGQTLVYPSPSAATVRYLMVRRNHDAGAAAPLATARQRYVQEAANLVMRSAPRNLNDCTRNPPDDTKTILWRGLAVISTYRYDP